MSDNNLLLRTLRMNAVFSGFCALAMFIAGDWIAAQLGLQGALPIYVVGGVLLMFAAQLLAIVRTRKFRYWEIAAILGADLAWVTASFVLVAVYYEMLTAIGLVMVDMVALAVLYFAIQQFRGLKQWRAQPQ